MLQIFKHSPYLIQLAQKYPSLLEEITEAALDDLIEKECFSLPESFASQVELMQELRHAKNKLALLVAAGDLSGFWPLEKVTGTLSRFADYALQTALHFLLSEAMRQQIITLKHPDSPSQESGVIVLGMGKLGAFELNYSSDIDIIIFYEPGVLAYAGRKTEQHFMNRLAQDLVNIMQERTTEGYVFRTDLRLRPDPASTPAAVNIDAALRYYESVGQNWERAAMIKARAIAGDIIEGEAFIQSLSPYLWRRNLDFAAINDIHSIKRQMDARTERIIQTYGHNIKLGLGGIREIEFYTQIHQLIWGGRKPGLRLRGTCETLKQLVVEGLIEHDVCDLLIDAYYFYRLVEHRLQMIADAQTHTLPDNKQSMASLAEFAGFENISMFEQKLLFYLRNVHELFAGSFKTAEDLGDEGHLVFTGVTHDPETLQTLRQMGYKQVEAISEIIMGWHHGSRRCTRPQRARELLTELMPTLLKRLAETANPDTAFIKFDDFMTRLPAAVQLFSLFQQNPKLLGLVADIMGSAPSLADTLSRSPELIENVLFADFYDPLPDYDTLQKQAHERIAYTHDTEELIAFLAGFRNEKHFQSGVHLLRGMVDSHDLGRFLSDLATMLLNVTLRYLMAEFQHSYGTIKGGEFAIIALGKLGSRELTFHSDLDLVFIYRVPDDEALSDGEKSFNARVYYNRMAQRLVGTLSALGNAGRLYEVDTRLRPSGKEGLLAVSDKALAQYFEESAWTFEYMAFTKGQAVAGDVPLCQDLNRFMAGLLTKKRDVDMLKSDVAYMRRRIAEEHPSQNHWDLKYVRGGLIDLDFIAQYLLLTHAPQYADAYMGSSREIIQWCKRHKILPAPQLDTLLQAEAFLSHLLHLLRLCLNAPLDEKTAMVGLKRLLCQNMQYEELDDIKKELVALEDRVYQSYLTIIETST